MDSGGLRPSRHRGDEAARRLRLHGPGVRGRRRPGPGGALGVAVWRMRVCLGSARCAGRNGGLPENGDLSERPVAEGRAKLRIVRTARRRTRWAVHQGGPAEATVCPKRRSVRKVALTGYEDCAARVQRLCCSGVRRNADRNVRRTGRAGRGEPGLANRLPCSGPAGVGRWRVCRHGQACACSPGAVWLPAAASVGRGICFRFIVDIVKASRKEWFNFEPCRSTLNVCFM